MTQRNANHDDPTNGITISRLSTMTGGWFIGAFTPAAYTTCDMEVAVQFFPAGYEGVCHVHHLATEITLLLTGRAVMADRFLSAGDILVLPPGISSSFMALEDCQTVVVKHPGVLNDKYLTGNVSC